MLKKYELAFLFDLALVFYLWGNKTIFRVSRLIPISFPSLIPCPFPSRHGVAHYPRLSRVAPGPPGAWPAAEAAGPVAGAGTLLRGAVPPPMDGAATDGVRGEFWFINHLVESSWLLKVCVEPLWFFWGLVMHVLGS